MRGKIFRKGNARKLLSFVLSLTMVLALMPVNSMTVYAVGATPGACGICGHDSISHNVKFNNTDVALNNLRANDDSIVSRCFECDSIDAPCIGTSWGECLSYSSGGSGESGDEYGGPTTLYGVDITVTGSSWYDDDGVWRCCEDAELAVWPDDTYSNIYAAASDDGYITIQETSSGNYECIYCGATISWENHVHTYSTAWTSNETQHWHVADCEHTSERSDKANHNWGTWNTEDAISTRSCTVCDREATCNHVDETGADCSVCGKTLKTAHTHDLQKTDEQAATCTTDGVKEYYRCKSETCGKYFSDAEGTSEITDLEAWKTGDGKIAIDHTWGYEANGATITATCGRDNAHTATLTLSAGNADYSGNTVEATITDIDDAWVTYVGELPSIIYYTDEACTIETAYVNGASSYGCAPTEGGDYWATITVGLGEDAKTAKVAFSIAQPMQVYKMSGDTEIPAVENEDYEWYNSDLFLYTDGLIVSGGSSDNFVTQWLFFGDSSHQVTSATLKDLYLTGSFTLYENTQLTLKGTNQIGAPVEHDWYGIRLYDNVTELTVTGSGTLTIYDRFDGIKAEGDANVTFDDDFTGTLTIIDKGDTKEEAAPPPPCAISIGEGTLTVNNGTLNLISEQKNGITAKEIKINGGTVIAQGGLQAMSVAPTLGTGMKVEIASENYDGSSPAEAYSSDNISAYKYLKIAKTHTWTYSADGAVLTATCDKGCGAETAHTATLTLSATGSDYSDSVTGWCEAEDIAFELNGTTDWEDAELAVPTIHYAGTTADGTAYANDSKPAEEGNYTAYIECDENKAEISFKVGHDFSKKTISDEYLASAADYTSPAQYYYACDICGAKGTKTYADGSKLQLATPELSAPTVTANSIVVKWGKVTDAVYYRVYKKDANGSWKKVKDVKTTSFEDTDVESGKTYSYTVRCLSADRTVYTSAYDKTGVSATYCSVPELKSATPEEDGVKVAWNKVPGAAVYRVYRKEEGGSWAKLKDTLMSSIVDKTAVSGTTYAYTVKCMSADRTTSTSVYDKSGISVTYCSVPVVTSLSASNSGIKVTWDEVPGAGKYRVYRKIDDGSWKRVATVATTTYTDRKVTPGTKYSYTLMCANEEDTVSLSTYDKTGKGLLLCENPVSKSIANCDGGVRVTWDAVEGATGYRIYRKVEGGNWTSVGSTKGLSFTDKTVENGTVYSFTVRSLDVESKAYVSGYDTTGLTIKYYACPKITELTAETNGVNVTWESIEGVSKYRVYRKVEGGNWTKVADSTSTSCVDTKAVKGTRYTYTVRCLSEDGKTNLSAYNSVGQTIDFE